MSKKRSQTPEYQWEQALIDAYFDFRCHEVFDPLYDKFQQWKAGELSHSDIDRAIHEVHKQNQEIYRFFMEKRTWLVTLIQFNQEWFQGWVKDNPPPAGYDLVKPSDL